MPFPPYDGQMQRLQRAARGAAAERLVVLGGAAILACDLIDPTLDARIYAASEQAISLLDAGSLLAHKGRLLRDWALFWASGFVGGFAGGPGFAERLALAVVGVLLFLGARRSR